MKNKLIELLNNFYDEYFDTGEECDNECEAIAEYLLAHGVIVPSCETEDRTLIAIFILNDIEGVTELKIPVHHIEQRNGWILGVWNDLIISCIKEEYIKACYLQLGT